MERVSRAHHAPASHAAAPRFGRLRSLASTLIVVAALSWLGAEIISTTAADTYASGNPERALAWQRDHPASLIALASQELASADSEADLDAIFRAARRALGGDPLQDGAISVMALAAERAGDPSRAESLMELAGSRSLREARVQAWLLDRRLSTKEYAQALGHADAILRVWPKASDALLAVLAAFANDLEGRNHLTSVLKTDPPWRKWFLTALPGQSDNPSALYDLYADLKAGETPVTTEEFRPYLQRLTETGDYALAYAMQVDFLPAERIAMLGLLNNGGFDHPISGLPFDWTIGTQRGARTEIVVDGDSNRALRVEFYGSRVPFRHVSQLLLLQPGRYRLQGEAKSVRLANDRGMQWIIACAAPSGKVLLATERVAGTRPWTTFAAPFEVPDEKECRAQELKLVLAARIPAEQEVSGEIWYDNLRIARQDPDLRSSQSDRGNGDG